MYSSIILFLVLLLVLTLVINSQDSSSLLVPDSEDNDDDNQKGMFNFASHAAGAVILDKSPANAKGFSNLLNDDKDKYAIATCSEKKWVVIGLSEDILVKTVVLANYEKYSSQLKNFQLLASTSFPTDQWINLGTYQAEPKLGEQVFEVTNSSSHTRYLKFKFMTHYDNEALCTLSQIKVHGTTVIASFQEEVKMSEATMRDMLSQLNLDENIQKTEDKNESDSTISSIQTNDAEGTQQFIQVDANNVSIVEEVVYNSSNEANLISNIDDNLDLSKMISEDEITMVGEDISITKDTENDVGNKESLGENTQENDIQITTPIDEDLSQDNLNDGTDIGDTVTSERINDISNISSSDNKEGVFDSVVEKSSLDDKTITESIESEDDTIVDEDKGTSLMQAIAESTVHAVKEIVLGPLRQIPKPKIQHGKPSSGTVPLIEVENLLGISTKNDNIENIVTPDKLVTDIKDLDKHHRHRSHSVDNSVAIVENNINDTSSDIKESNKTTESVDTNETTDAVKSGNEDVTEVIPSIDQDIISKNVSVAFNTTSLDEELKIGIEAKEDLVSLQSNITVDLIVKNSTEIEADGNNDLKQEEIVNNFQPIAVIYDEIENSTIPTLDANVSIVESDTIISDIDRHADNTNVTLTGVITDNNTTSIVIDAIDQAVMIVERPKNDSLLTNTKKKNPILQPTSPSRVVPPLPSNCLETLKFADFQAKMVAKLVNTSDDKDRSVPLTSQDNVFRHLMQKIKMLEMNYAIIEMYSIQIGDCYRAVLGDLAGNVSSLLASKQAEVSRNEAEVLTNISYNRQIKYDNLKLTGGNGIMNKGRDKVIIDGLENLLRYNEDDVIQLIAVALILGLLSLFISAAIGLYVLFKLRKQKS